MKVDSTDVLFTSGATESNNMAIKGVAKQNSHFIISDLEHNAVLRPLEKMKQLKHFSLLYTDSAQNIETIGKLNWLESLSLCGIYTDNLDFLDFLPDHIELELCGIEIYGRKQVNVQKWKRFTKRDICEIEVKDQWWEYVDLSVLDT